MKNDPVEIIKTDHTEVEGLFAEYEALGDGAVATKQNTADQIIDALTIHAEMEETLCYPRFKDALTKEEDKLVAEAYVEHDGVKKLLTELKTLDPAVPEFDATMKVLMEQVRHHVKEEEGELLPVVEKEMKEEDLAAMGDEMLTFKESRVLDIE